MFVLNCESVEHRFGVNVSRTTAQLTDLGTRPHVLSMAIQNTEFKQNCTHALEIGKLPVLGSLSNAAVELAHVVVAASFNRPQSTLTTCILILT